MVQDHQRRDIALRREVGVGVRNRARHRCQLRRRQRPLRELRGRPNHRRIAHVLRGHRPSRDVPAAPSLRQRRPVVDDNAVGVGVGIVGHRERAERHEAGHGERVPRQMTQEAAHIAGEARRLRPALRERVEDDALFGILRGDLQQLRGGHPTDRDAVAEVNRARMARADLLRLPAGLREDQHLRFRRDAERIEERAQVSTAVRVLEREARGAGRERFAQAAHAVGALPFGVRDRRVLARGGKCVAPLRRKRGGGAYRHHDDCRRRREIEGPHAEIVLQHGRSSDILPRLCGGTTMNR